MSYANPEIVYVPEYDPRAVYAVPVAPWPGWYWYPGLYWISPDITFGSALESDSLADTDGAGTTGIQIGATTRSSKTTTPCSLRTTARRSETLLVQAWSASRKP